MESSPEDVEGRKVSNSFLYNATVATFEQQGFPRTRQRQEQLAGDKEGAPETHLQLTATPIDSRPACPVCGRLASDRHRPPATQHSIATAVSGVATSARTAHLVGAC